jgi:threo-3-hydroxy-L-aspartate ammonia-lyase
MQRITLDDITAASKRIHSVPGGGVVRTPLLPVPGADRSPAGRPDRPLWLKPECLQPTGAFKIRGALNAIATLPERVRSRGVVAYSSGNHARAVAYAARVFGVPATVVVPHTAPAAKIAAARELGAEIVPVEVADREARAREIVAERAPALIAPFDDPAVIAGQGTVGLEIAEDMAAGVVLVPISGGGLISGIAVAIKALHPAATVVGVEPELAADARDSLRAGERRSWPVELRTRTAADGLTAEPSELTFDHIRRLVDDIVTVSEDEIAGAVRYLAVHGRVVAERSGAVSTAAYLHRDLPAGPTVAVVSGGNINPADLATALAD